MNLPIGYSLGSNTYDNCPEQWEAADFNEFRNEVLSTRSARKHLTYICGPCADAPDDEKHRALKPGGKGPSSVVGEPYRSAATALPRRFLGLDATSPRIQ